MKVPGMLHARNVRPPVAGAHAAQHRRIVGSEPAGFRPRREPRQLRGRGLRARGAGDRGRARAESRMDAAGTAPFPASTSCSTTSAPRRRRRARSPRSKGTRHAALASAARVARSRVRGAVPGAHRHRPGARAGRSVGRAADDLLERHEGVRPAQRRREVLRHAARPRARGLHGRAAGLRPHGRGRCRLRGRVPRERAGQTRARAVDAPRGNGVGHERARRTPSSCAAGSMRRASWRRSSTTRAPSTTPTWATTSPTRC